LMASTNHFLRFLCFHLPAHVQDQEPILRLLDLQRQRQRRT
jgi:hypothetical protein